MSELRPGGTTKLWSAPVAAKAELSELLELEELELELDELLLEELLELDELLLELDERDELLELDDVVLELDELLLDELGTAYVKLKGETSWPFSRITITWYDPAAFGGVVPVTVELS